MIGVRVRVRVRVRGAFPSGGPANHSLAVGNALITAFDGGPVADEVQWMMTTFPKRGPRSKWSNASGA